jgi:hypothetical protein
MVDVESSRAVNILEGLVTKGSIIYLIGHVFRFVSPI